MVVCTTWSVAQLTVFTVVSWLIPYFRETLELLVTQYHEREGVEHVWSLQRSVDRRRKVHHGGRSSYSNFREHTTYVWDTLRNTYTHTPSMMTRHPHRIRSSHILEMLIHLNQWGGGPSNNLDRPRGRVPRSLQPLFSANPRECSHETKNGSSHDRRRRGKIYRWYHRVPREEITLERI